MNWKPWVLGIVALAVFDTALVFGVKAYWRSRAAPLVDPVALTSPPGSPATSVQSVPAVPKSMQQACMNGVTWVYDDRWQRWFKLSPVVPCKLGTVRSENDREGLIVRHPKGWRSDGGSNLTQ